MTFFPSLRCSSIRRMTMASIPIPALNRNQRLSVWPSPTVLRFPEPSPATNWLVAVPGSDATPSARAKTFALPPGTTPTAGNAEESGRPSRSGVPSMPLTVSFTEPSPPCTTTAS